MGRTGEGGRLWESCSSKAGLSRFAIRVLRRALSVRLPELNQVPLAADLIIQKWRNAKLMSRVTPAFC